ncbi:hypothetical protein BREVNS_2286 [Brevinematales bacterium NS]|nr:hypothetical protein [Brevinematales bacterium]QJR23036.1 hypothetical protein BREVNS_2286 [Brevinematales bacterium NS]
MKMWRKTAFFLRKRLLVLVGLSFVSFIEVAMATTFTLRPYVLSSNDMVSLQDLIQEKLPTNTLLDSKKSSYNASEVGQVMKQLGFGDFVLVGKEVVVFRGIRLLTPEEWYTQLFQAYPGTTWESVDLPERFEVLSENREEKGIYLTCRVYLPHSWRVQSFFVPVRQVFPVSSSFLPVYGFERIGEKEGFLTYRGKGVSIRIPVRLISSPQSEVILVENKINSRILRLKREEIEGL